MTLVRCSGPCFITTMLTLPTVMLGVVSCCRGAANLRSSISVLLSFRGSSEPGVNQTISTFFICTLKSSLPYPQLNLPLLFWSYVICIALV